MSHRPSVLAIITARGGSKGLPGKNVRDLAGKPLIAWTIEAALQARSVDRVILSSDDPAIIAAAEAWGCEVPFVRPAELAQDDTPGLAPVVHAIESLEVRYDYIVLLQPTSPLRTAADIDACVALCLERGAPGCVSVTPSKHHPYWMYRLTEDHLVPFVDVKDRATRRQELPAAYGLNGAIYVAKTDWLLTHRTFVSDETLGYVMPPERSIDIDTATDLAIAALLLTQ